MTHIVLWFVLAFGLLIAELMTGTFYLLMVALGFVAGGIAAWLGAAIEFQLAIGAAVGIVATVILRRTRWGMKRLQGDAGSNPDVLLDIGQVVQVTEWRDGMAKVHYRGCQWDAALEPGAAASAGTQVIKAIRGSTLIVAPAARCRSVERSALGVRRS